MSYLRFVCCVLFSLSSSCVPYMLPVSLDCVVFSLSSSCVPFVASFSALYIVDCPYGILYRLFNTDNTYVSDNFKKSPQIYNYAASEFIK
jgi:hypothetical protein